MKNPAMPPDPVETLCAAVDAGYEDWLRHAICHERECGCVTEWIKKALTAALPAHDELVIEKLVKDFGRHLYMVAPDELKAHDALVRAEARLEEARLFRMQSPLHNGFEPDNCNCVFCQRIAQLESELAAARGKS